MASNSSSVRVYSSKYPNSGSYYYTLSVSFNENSTNTLNNTSNITVTGTLSSTGIGYAGSANDSWGIYWTDNNTNYLTPLKEEIITSLTKNSSKTISATFDVGHKTDGTLNGFPTIIYNKSTSNAYAPNSKTLSTDTTPLITIPRYTSITSFEVYRRDETSVKFNYSASDALDWAWYSTDNGYSWKDLNSNNIVSGLSPNTGYNFKLAVRRADSQLTTYSNAYYQSTYDTPNVYSTHDFSIGDTISLGVYNPLNRTIKVQILQHSTNRVLGQYDGNYNGILSGFNSASNQQTQYSSLTPPTNNGKYYVKVECAAIGSSRVYNVSNNYYAKYDRCKPTITATLKDVNTITTTMTGNDNQIIICDAISSIIRVTPSVSNISNSNDLTTTISKYNIDGTNFTNSNYDIYAPKKVDYQLFATNSRNYESNILNLIGERHPYIQLTLSANFKRPIATGTRMAVQFNGNFYDGYFNTSNNTNQNELSLKWYVRESEDDEWTLGGTFTQNTDYTITNNKYSSNSYVELTCPQSISSGHWYYMTKYYFKLVAEDNLNKNDSAVIYAQYVTIGQPYYDWWTENGVNYFNVNGIYLKDNKPLGSYSTTEINTGKKWIDGKDIYSLTITLNSTISLVSSTWTNLFNISSYNINRLTSATIFRSEYSIMNPKYIKVDSTYLKAWDERADAIKQIIIEYTKN